MLGTYGKRQLFGISEQLKGGDFDMKSGIVEYGNIIAIPPGETIKELLKNKEWTQAELARRTGYSEKHISKVVNGKNRISVEAAIRLERALGMTAEFWLKLENNYSLALARIEQMR